MALKKLEAAALRLSNGWSSSDGLEGTGATPEVAYMGWLGRAQAHIKMAGEGRSVGEGLDNAHLFCVSASLCRQSVALDVLQELEVLRSFR